MIYPTRAELKKEFKYNQDTGALIRKTSGWKDCSLNARGYVRVQYKGENHSVHRLIFLMVYGWLPSGIDHKNGCKHDNRISNLRACNQSENGGNRRINKNNSSGYKGVCFKKSAGKWEAQVTVRGNTKYLGLFETPEEAHLEYCKKSVEGFGVFANNGVDNE